MLILNVFSLVWRRLYKPESRSDVNGTNKQAFAFAKQVIEPIIIFKIYSIF